MAFIRLCPVCGSHAGACNSPRKGGGLIYTRLKRPGEEEKSMPKVRLSKYDYYFTNDKTRVVRRGDKDAAFLLARTGSPIDEAVVEHFGLETTEGESIATVVQPMPSTDGVSAEVAAGYQRMAATRATNAALQESTDRAHGTNTSRQVGATIQGAVNAALGLVDGRPEQPGQLRTPDLAGGQTGPPLSVTQRETVASDEAVREATSAAANILKTSGGAEGSPVPDTSSRISRTKTLDYEPQSGPQDSPERQSAASASSGPDSRSPEPSTASARADSAGDETGQMETPRIRAELPSVRQHTPEK